MDAFSSNITDTVKHGETSVDILLYGVLLNECLVVLTSGFFTSRGRFKRMSDYLYPCDLLCGAFILLFTLIPGTPGGIFTTLFWVLCSMSSTAVFYIVMKNDTLTKLLPIQPLS